jgi:hypothetical protein
VNAEGVQAITRSKVPEPEHLGVQGDRDALRATNVVWIFGFGRSGGTWLSSLMGEMEDHTLWHEPAVGSTVR